MFRTRHLREDRLFEYYAAEHSEEPIEPTACEHLADCASCYARYIDLRTFMDGLRAEADAELDDVFPDERLRSQQLQITRRIEHVVHPARVIAFPRHLPDQRAPAPRSRVAPRWIGAAAAAGLVLGLGLGTFLNPGAPVTEPRGAPAVGVVSTPVGGPAAPAESPVVSASVLDPTTDTEQFLSELEFALERPHTPELLALDDMTPHVREIRVQLR